MKKFILPALVSVGLFACSDEAPKTDTQADTATSQSNLPANAPVVKVVSSGNIPPLEYLDENGIAQGIEIELLRAIGENQGFKVEFYNENFANILPSLE